MQILHECCDSRDDHFATARIEIEFAPGEPLVNSQVQEMLQWQR